jgi:hypothetical protein
MIILFGVFLSNRLMRECEPYCEGGKATVVRVVMTSRYVVTKDIKMTFTRCTEQLLLFTP